MKKRSHCASCGAEVLDTIGHTHEYLASPPGCWKKFVEVLEREYTDYRYAQAHQLTVDAYTLQHVDQQENLRMMRSANIHLASLYMVFEKKLNSTEAGIFKQRFAKDTKTGDSLVWLPPPASVGTLTIHEVWQNKEPKLHLPLVTDWAKSVWEAWSMHHMAIQRLVSSLYHQ